MPAVHSYDVIEVKRRVVISAASPEDAIEKAYTEPELNGFRHGSRWETVELTARRTDIPR